MIFRCLFILLVSVFYSQEKIPSINPDKNIHVFNPLNQSLGRDKDPQLTTDISALEMFKRKAIWSTLSLPGMRFMSNLLYPKSTIPYFDIDQRVVAFSIDDGFCGLDNPGGDMINEVRELFAKYNSKSTFFVTGTHCNRDALPDVKLLLDDGHEIANHNMFDWPYNKYSKEEFRFDFNQTHLILNEYTVDIPKWFRAPHGKLSKEMQQVIDEKGYTHVVCDGYANDTSIPDAAWISKFILKRVKPGSILLIHMPEKGVREWNYKAMELTLTGLRGMEYRVVTISELHDIANAHRDSK